MPTYLETIQTTLARTIVRRFRKGVYDRLQLATDLPVRDGTYPVLLGLLRGGDSSAAHLSQRTGADRTVVSRQASELTRAGLIERLPGTSDAREVMLRLTPAGRETAMAMRAEGAQMMKEVFADWSPEDVATFARLFPQFIDDCERIAGSEK